MYLSAVLTRSAISRMAQSYHELLLQAGMSFLLYETGKWIFALRGKDGTHTCTGTVGNSSWPERSALSLLCLPAFRTQRGCGRARPVSFCALRRGEGKRIATSWSVSSPVPESCDLPQECVPLGYGSIAEQDEKRGRMGFDCQGPSSSTCLGAESPGRQRHISG